MKIQLLSAMHGRHSTVKTALESWRNNGLDPLMVVSQGRDVDFCSYNNIKWTWANNSPLSKKWQHGIDYLKRNSDADAFLMLGSDDVIEGADNYVKYLEQGYEFIGIKDLFLKDLRTGKIKHWQGYTNHRKGESAGAGRCLSRSLMNKLDWQLWRINKDNGLDGDLTNKLKNSRT